MKCSAKHTPLYENEQKERDMIQWRILFAQLRCLSHITKFSSEIDSHYFQGAKIPFARPNKYFVNLKSNSNLLYKKGHNLLTSDFYQKMLN